jgi:hypothetical protein
MPPKIGGRHAVEIRFAGQRASQAADRIFHAAFLPGAVRIAEERLYAESLVEPVMFSKLVSVVEADGPAHLLWQSAELTGDVLSSGDGFSIGWTMNNSETGFSFVKNQQSLTRSGEHHEVCLPMAWCPATFDLRGALGNRATLFNEAARATAQPSTSSNFLMTRQQAVPVIPLGRAMINETID